MNLRGIIFYNRGYKCCHRMLLAMYTLRKFYNGSITLLIQGEQPDGFLELVKNFNVNIKEIPDREGRTLALKTTLYRDSPYDTTIFFDADFCFINPIDFDNMFSKTEEYGWCSYHYEDWSTKGGKMRKRINNMLPVCPEHVQPTIDYGYAINTGIFSFIKDSPMLAELEELALKTARMGVNKVVVDEIAANMLLYKHKHYLFSKYHGRSTNYGNITDKNLALHGHGDKSFLDNDLCELIKINYWEMVRKYPSDFYEKQRSSKRVTRYIREIKNKDLTIVTAVDRKYLPKLHKNYQNWVKTTGIMEYPMICFYDKNQLSEWEVASIVDKRVELIPWTFQTDSQRERMLNCFCKGIADNVKTTWHIKLDADSYFNDNCKTKFGWKFELPVECWDKENIISGNRWGYVKPGQFLYDLEMWANEKFPNTKPCFPKTEYPKMIEQKRYGYKRIASYLCLIKTSFVVWANKECKGRMPIPSHDTYLHYLAMRFNKKYLRLRMKQWANSK